MVKKRSRFQYIIGWFLIVIIVIASVFAIITGITESDGIDTIASTENHFVQDIITSAGPWGPVVFVFAQALQAVVAPIPGPVIAMAGGYLYGGAWATLLSLVGSTLGFLVVFHLSKKIGRPILLRRMKPERLEKYEQVVAARGGLFLYIAFLMPILPDSIIGYIAGLSNLPIKKLLFIAIISRSPGIIMAAYIGSAAAAANYTITITGLAFVAIISIIFYLYQEPFEHWLLKQR